MRAFQNANDLRSYLPEPGLFTDYRALLGDGDPNPDIVVLKYQPSGWDMKDFKPFLGKDGIPIRRHFVQQGVKAYYTTTFPFFAGGAKATTKNARMAAPVVAEELRRVPASKYLLMGADAARFCPLFSYPFKRFDEIVGRTFELEGKRFRVTHAPAAVVGNPSIFAEFLRGVEELLNPPTNPLVATPEIERYQVLQNRLQARRVFERAGNLVAVDLETTGLDPWSDRILTLQVSPEEGIGYAFPWELFEPAEWGALLGGRHLVFQNGTFDVRFLAVNGVHVQIHEDAMLMHSLVDETPGTHSMELMAQRYLGVDKWGDTVNYDDMEGNDLQTLGRYGARDTDLTLRLANHFRPFVENRFVHKVIHRAQNAITRSEVRGIKVDREKALEFQRDIEKALHDKQIYLADVYGLENANSPAQVQTLLVDRMQLRLPKLRGKVSTSSAIIEPFAEEHPVVRDILEYRHLTKAGSTYVRKILEVSERDGRYHAQFKLAGTETGRVTEPLITLIPRADDLANPDLGKQYQVRLRELFVADEGYVMIGADYRGLEVGMGAYLTNDPQLIDDYNTKLDTHSVVAIQGFGLPIELEPRATLKKRVQAQYAFQREVAKRGTFTWLYGGSARAIVEQIGCSLEMAEQILDALRLRYAGVQEWQDRVRATVREHGSITTPWGRTRRFLIHPALDERQIEDQLRESINAPNQGMSSDMNLAAFAEVEARGIQTLFPFHDAIYAQARVGEEEKVARTIKNVMEGVLPGPVQFEADVKTGPNWASLG